MSGLAGLLLASGSSGGLSTHFGFTCEETYQTVAWLAWPANLMVVEVVMSRSGVVER